MGTEPSNGDRIPGSSGNPAHLAQNRLAGQDAYHVQLFASWTVPFVQRVTQILLPTPGLIGLRRTQSQSFYVGKNRFVRRRRFSIAFNCGALNPAILPALVEGSRKTVLTTPVLILGDRL